MFDPLQPVGSNLRYNHEDCGDKRGRLYVKFDGGGWAWYCHNCSARGYKRAGALSVTQTRELLLRKGTHEASVSDVFLPSDSMPVPNREKGWLLKYGLTEDEIKRYGICWSDRYKRIILPVYHEDKLVAYQARSVNEQPKYLTIHNGDRQPFITNLSSNICVLVEDIVSAIKVGRVSCGIALLGSYVSVKLINWMQNKDRIYIWLDYDKKVDALKYAVRFSQLLGKPVKPIITKLDPKCYSTEQISNYIST